MATKDKTSWLPGLLGPITLQVNGTEVQARQTVNLVGSITASDDGTTMGLEFESGGTTPTGTGLRKVVDGTEVGAASKLVNADVANGAAIHEAKLRAGAIEGAQLRTMGGVPGWVPPEGSVTWAPAIDASFGSTYATWEEIKTVIAAATVPLDVWIDTTADGAVALIPDSSTLTNCRNLVTLRAAPNSRDVVVTVMAGATLKDLVGIENLTLLMPSDGTPALDFTYPGGQQHFAGRRSAFLDSTGASTPPLIVPDGFTLILDGLDPEGDIPRSLGVVCGGVPVVQLGTTGAASAYLKIQGSLFVNDASFASSDPGSSLTVDYEAIQNVGTGADRPWPSFPDVANLTWYSRAVDTETPRLVAFDAGGPYEAKAGEIVIVDASGGDQTILLPSANLARRVTVKSTTANENNFIVGVANDSNNLDGVTNGTVSVSCSSVLRSRTFVSDGANSWWIVGGFG